MAVWPSQMVKFNIPSLNKILSYFSYVYVLEGENSCLSTNNSLYGTLLLYSNHQSIMCYVVWCDRNHLLLCQRQTFFIFLHINETQDWNLPMWSNSQTWQPFFHLPHVATMCTIDLKPWRKGQNPNMANINKKNNGN